MVLVHFFELAGGPPHKIDLAHIFPLSSSGAISSLKVSMEEAQVLFLEQEVVEVARILL